MTNQINMIEIKPLDIGKGTPQRDEKNKNFHGHCKKFYLVMHINW